MNARTIFLLPYQRATRILSRRESSPRGFTLLESIVALAFMALLAGLTTPYLSKAAKDSKANSCYMNNGEMDMQVQLWFRDYGYWPDNDLSDIGRDQNYFPRGLPKCPVDGSPYKFDPTTQKVVKHRH